MWGKYMNYNELQELKLQILNEKRLQNISDLFPKMSAYDYLYDCNKDRQDCYALNYLGNKITFGEFFQKIDTTAKAYKEMGIKAGDFVSMCMLTTPEAIISFYALNKLGAVVHMINIANSKEDITKHLLNTNSKTFITLDIFYDKKMKKAMDNAQVENVVVSSLTDSLFVGLNSDKVNLRIIEALKKFGNAVKLDDRCKRWETIQNIGKNSHLTVDSVYVPDAGATIAYTSGSMGEAKAVLATNESINAMPVQMGMTDQTFAPNDSIFNSLPTWIYYSLVNNIHDPLCLGVCVDIDPLLNPKKINVRLEQFRFNHWNTIPDYVDDMVKNKKVKKLDLSHLKSITTGGDYLSIQLQASATELVQSRGANMIVGQGYGASELLGSFSYTYDKDSTKGSVGKPLVGNRFKIIDLETKKELGSYETGELYLTSATLMKGYYNNPSATDEALVKDENGIIWYRTGDLAYYNDKNEIFIDGRIRRIVMAKDDNGLPTKIFPDKIKKIILTHNLVDKCEVITVDDKKYIKRPVAYIVLKDQIQVTPSIEREIRDLCMSHLENYTLPREYKFIPTMPLKPSMKPDLDVLAKKYEEELQGKVKKKVR